MTRPTAPARSISPKRRPPKLATPEAISALELVVTADCNLGCTYCFQDRKRPSRMSWATVRRAIALLLRSHHEQLALVFYGGEPLLELDRIERAVRYAERRLPPDKTIRFELSTNGLLLDERAAALLDAHGVRTQLSFDGVAAAQDLRGRDTFPTLDATLDRLRREHPRFFARDLEVAITLTAAALPHLADSFDYLLGKGVSTISIGPSATHDAGWRSELIHELDRQFSSIYRSSLRHYRQTGRVPLLQFRKAPDDTLPAAPMGAICRAASGRTLTVDVDGRVYGCVMLAESYQTFRSDFLRERVVPMRLGRLDDPEFRERLARLPRAARTAGIFNDLRGKHSGYGACRECRHRMTCCICPVSIGHIPDNTDPRRVPDNQCAYQRVCLAYRERFPVDGEPQPTTT